MAFRSPRKVADKTQVQLAGSASYFGPWIDAINYNKVGVAAGSDQAGTLVVYQALNSDGSGTVMSHVAAVVAASQNALVVDIVGRYVRLAYVNGATPSTTFAACLTLLP